MDKVVNCLFAAITLLLSVRAEVLRGKKYVCEWLLWLCVCGYPGSGWTLACVSLIVSNFPYFPCAKDYTFCLLKHR